jgi:Calcium/calmodulin dependent protein kinase II Association.
MIFPLAPTIHPSQRMPLKHHEETDMHLVAPINVHVAATPGPERRRAWHRLSISIAFLAVLAATGQVSAQAADTPQDATAEILRLEKQRQQAYLTRNWALLDPLIDDRIEYIHSDGRVDDRATYLANVSKVPTFLSTERVSPKVNFLGDDVALLSGVLRNKTQRAGGEIVEREQYLTQVWHRTPEGWRIVVYQLTAFPAKQ